jgi:predicted HicB family RNase H-like nuclease
MLRKRKKASRFKFLLRVDPDIHIALAAAAKRNDRSVTAEIRHRLRRSIETPTPAEAAA